MTIRFCAAAFVGVFVATSSRAQPSALPPVEAFGNLPTMAPLLSPDAKHFAFVAPINGRPAVAIYSTTPGEKPVLIGGGNEGIIDYVLWAKNDRLIIVGKQGLTEFMDRLRTWRRAFSVDITGKNMAKLGRNIPSMGNNVNGADVIDVDLDDPDNVLMALWEFKVQNQDQLFSRLHQADDIGAKFDVIKVDVHSGKGELLKTGDYNTVDWLSDGHGNPSVQIYQTKNPLQEHVLALRDGRWVDFGAYDATEDNDAGIVGFSQDGKTLVQGARNDESLTGLVTIDIATGAKAPLFFAKDRDIDGTLHDQWTRRVIGVTWIEDKLEAKYFDPKLDGLQHGLESAFPGQQVSIISYDQSRNFMVVGVDAPRQPTQYFFLDRTTHQTTLLASTYPGLKEADLGEVKPYLYKARDGLDIPAYITLPPGKAAKNLPVVVMPHGGPDNRDFIHFDWMAQFLANRGYLVLQPNFRGSSGYGHKFTEAGLNQWGLKMQDDITDGVNKLITDGIADPKRICIVGGSYGGYAALAGATFTPDLYACAASWAGVADLPAQMGAALKGAERESKIASFWFSRMGDNLEQLAATSPARHADRIKCPILLLHGANDTTVPIEQSQLMADALKKAGKPVEFVTYEGEDHYLELASTRIRVLKELERFLKVKIGN